MTQRPVGAMVAGLGEEMEFVEKLSRIRELGNADRYDNIAASFMRAYVGCLTLSELGDVMVGTLSESLSMHRTIRKRLGRLCDERQTSIDDLAERLIRQEQEPKLRPRIEAGLSHLYLAFSPSQRLKLLNRWQDKGTLSAGARWLKALDSDPMHYSNEAVVDYWRNTRDWRAVSVLVRRATLELLEGIVLEFIENGVEGWAIGKAIMRVGSASEEAWEALRERQPATYAYLCAKGLRSLSGEEAIQLVLDSPDEFYNGGRGLAIWSLGQLGLERALDELWIKIG